MERPLFTYHPNAYDLSFEEVEGICDCCGQARALRYRGPFYTRLRPDLAFVGCNGIHAAFVLSTPDPIEAVVKTAIIQTSRRVVVLCDSAKHDQETLMRFASLDEIDTLITDRAPGPELAAALEEADVEVVIA